MISAIKKHFFKILAVTFLSSILAVGIYLLIGFFPSYFVSNKNMSLNQSMIISFIGLSVLTLFVHFVGVKVDQLGSKRILAWGAAGYIFFSYAIFYLAANGTFLFSVLSVCLTAILLAPIAASLLLILSNLFPTNVRYSGVSIGYNLGMTIFGGTTPIIIMSLTKYTESVLFSAIYITFCALLTAISLIILNNKKYDEGVGV